MKRKLFYFATFLVMALCSLTLASCGDDDDDDYGGDKALVGTWVKEVYEFDLHYYMGYRFTKDGYVSYFEWNEGESPNWDYNKTKFKAKNGTCTVYKPDGSVYRTYNYSISSDGKTLWVGEDSDAYTKQ